MKKITVICFAFILIILMSISEAHNYHGAAMAPNTLQGWVVTIDTSFIFHTTNGGQTWIDQSFFDPLSYFDIFSLNEQKAWVGGGQGFIHYTPNGGQNWYRQAMGLSKWAARIFFINDTCGWAACGSAFIGKTTRGNDTIYQIDLWEQINLTNPPYSADSCDIYGIHFIDQNRGWFCAGRYPEYDSVAHETLYTGGQGYIAKTTDGGGNPLTWQLLRRDTIFDFFDIKFIDSLTGFVVGGNDRNNAGVVMKSIDGGQNWQIVTSIPIQTKILRALEFVGQRHAWAVGRNGTIIRTTNGGTNWTLQQSNLDTTLFDVDFADTLHGIISGNGYVLYTNNGGDSWQIADVISIEEIKNLFVDSKKPMLSASPNPFNNQIKFMINSLTDKHNNIKIYDVTGNLIKILQIGNPPIIWNGRDDYNKQISTGIYFATLKTEESQSVIPIIYQK